MSDLVKRLRDPLRSATADPMCAEAADHIERLEAALQWYADKDTWGPVTNYTTEFWYVTSKEPWVKANAALYGGVPYPEFCRHPDKCRGTGRCQAEHVCND